MPLQCCKDKWPTIPDDEPVFVLRGKDVLAAETVRYWMNQAIDAGVKTDKLTKVAEHLAAIDAFQRDHPDRCKIPD